MADSVEKAERFNLPNTVVSDLRGRLRVGGLVRAGILSASLAPSLLFPHLFPGVMPKALAESPPSAGPTLLLEGLDARPEVLKSQTVAKETLEITGFNQHINSLTLFNNTPGQAMGKPEIKPDGQSQPVIAFVKDLETERRLILHELTHILDPRYQALGHIKEIADNQEDLKTDYNQMRQIYRQKYVGSNQLLTQYEQDILFRGAKEIGSELWADIAVSAGISKDDPIQAEKLAPLLSNPDLGELHKVLIREYLKSLPEGSSENWLGDQVLGQIFIIRQAILNPTGLKSASPYQLEYFKVRSEYYLASMMAEMWAEVGSEAFLYPKAVQMVFPEYFALLNDIYSKTTGKQIEDVASQLRIIPPKLKIKQLQQDLAYFYKETDILNWYLNEIKAHHKDGNFAKYREELRRDFIIDLQSAYSIRRLPMAEAFELALEDPSILN